MSTNVSASVAASAHGGLISPERDAARRWRFFIAHYLKGQRATLAFSLPVILMAALAGGWRRGGSHPVHSCLFWNVCRGGLDSLRQAREACFFGFSVNFGLLMLWWGITFELVQSWKASSSFEILSMPEGECDYIFVPHKTLSSKLSLSQAQFLSTLNCRRLKTPFVQILDWLQAFANV